MFESTAEEIGAHLAYPSNEHYLQHGTSKLKKVNDEGENEIYINCNTFTDKSDRQECNDSYQKYINDLSGIIQTKDGKPGPQNIIRTLYVDLENKNEELINLVKKLNNIINKVHIDDASVKSLLDSKKSNLEIMEDLQEHKNDLIQYEATYDNTGKRNPGTGGQYNMSITRKAQFEDIILKNKSENLKIYLWGSVALVTLLVAMRLNN